MDKQHRYSELVLDRKACRLCRELTNPSQCRGGTFDRGEHIGPWTRWQGNLNAHLMLVGQDWGGEDHYIRHRGVGDNKNATNKRICALLDSISLQVKLPNEAGPNSLFFTNAILCLRSRGLSGPTEQAWFHNCDTFLRQQIELVSPKVVATLGFKAYAAVMRTFDRFPKSRMQDAVTEVTGLPNGSSLVPLYHPGTLGTISRTFEQQKLDWLRVRKVLDRMS
ncbi:MAG TPA: uracil-DNA glycosylase family protein [Candidatus Binatia bacterium]|nr:uracil-DNA glycosylase family protein [Candidatus Binatia bacterium]